MYKIRGIDQKEYGPVTIEVLKQWLGEGRLDARTLLQAEGGTEWRPLSSFPELAALLQEAVPAAPPISPSRPAPVSAPQTSGLAIASLMLGAVGCLGITALAGLVLGIVSLVKISRSQGRLGGQGLAIGGICLSALMLLFSLLMMASLGVRTMARSQAMLPPMPPPRAVRPGQPPRARSRLPACVSNVKQICLGIRIYGADHDETLPPAATWCDLILPTVGGNQNVFHCPGDASGQRTSYAFNAKLDGLKLDKVDPKTVMIFESPGDWNKRGGLKDVVTNHPGLSTVGFVDGSVRQVAEADLPSLRWDP